MKRLKRWLALVLAVALLGANVVYSMGSELKANEIEQEQQAAQPENTGGQEQQTFTSDGVSVEVTDSGTETAEQTAVRAAAADSAGAGTGTAGEHGSGRR